MKPIVDIALLCFALAGTACSVDRRLRIETDPPGADVTIDGKFIGAAPLELHYLHYGERHVRISKRGFTTVEEVVNVEAPWYGTFPFDFFSEILFPVWRTDFRTESFALVPRTEAGGLTDAELRRQESEAVARARAMALWVPGDPMPAMARPQSFPARADSRPAGAEK